MTKEQQGSLSFNLLKREGISHIKELAGKLWTDYHEYDPGVTILEELCLAIIDLERRIQTDISDILSPNPDSLTEKNIKQFYEAVEILPCNPLTINDFIKIAIDVPGVKNAYIVLSGQAHKHEIKGGYKVFLDIEARVRKNNQIGEVVQQVTKKLHHYRNLCEDFFTVSCMKLQPVGIQAAFEINCHPTAEEAEILLAQIYFNIQSFLAPRVHFSTLSQMLKKGKTIDQILTGPILQKGFIDDAELASSRRTIIYTAEILEKITQLPTIKSVLKFEAFLSNAPTEKKIAISIESAYVLQLAMQQSEIILSYNGVPILIDKGKVNYSFEALLEKNALDSTYVYQVPIRSEPGNFSELATYTSIQQNFPVIYSVGDEGTSSNATVAEKASANQLKGYLMFFDQLFANYFSHLAHIKNIMAIHSPNEKKKYSNLPKKIPNLEKLMKHTAIDVGVNEVASDNDREFNIQKKYIIGVLDKVKHKTVTGDNYKYYLHQVKQLLATKEENCIQRSKMLDHLLARFAETFANYALFSYRQIGTEQLVNHNESKESFLQDYVGISRDRNKGVNVADNSIDYWSNQNITGFARRLYYKLGIKQLRCKFLHDILQKNIYLEHHAVQSSFELFLGKEIEKSHNDVLIFKGKFHKIRDLVIRYGSNEHNYTIVKHTNGTYGIKLYVDKVQQHNVEIINDKKPCLSREEAEKIINERIHFFNAFNKESEGFHLVEHILLRNGTQLKEHSDPYSFIMTLVFPSWPTRFQDESFRNNVQELVLLESPAHVFVNILWLDFKEMETFETAYKDWSMLRTTFPRDMDRLHQAAKALLGFIMLYTGDS